MLDQIGAGKHKHRTGAGEVPVSLTSISEMWGAE